MTLFTFPYPACPFPRGMVDFIYLPIPRIPFLAGYGRPYSPSHTPHPLSRGVWATLFTFPYPACPFSRGMGDLIYLPIPRIPIPRATSHTHEASCRLHPHSRLLRRFDQYGKSKCLPSPGVQVSLHEDVRSGSPLRQILEKPLGLFCSAN